eukprot:c8338_g1_i1.p1 GENE.c8338_g1_i1~~c8338_g1_i1.p1  ORF type:complete len:532 (-),score=218.19 c8338_g1_i1:31-1626(-)
MDQLSVAFALFLVPVAHHLAQHLNIIDKDFSWVTSTTYVLVFLVFYSLISVFITPEKRTGQQQQQPEEEKKKETTKTEVKEVKQVKEVKEVKEKYVEFITDVEGNWDYFTSLVQNSPVLSFEQGWKLKLKENCKLVFGGDVVDKSDGDIRVTKTLLALKKERPNDVFFILGNRDFNKLRFSSELQPNERGSNVDVYWDSKHQKYVDYIAEKKLEDNSVSTLKWMLQKTMGCPETFETRRAELTKISGFSKKVSDEDVLQSFRDSVDPNSSDHWMLDYICAGQLALVLDDCIFIHGGIGTNQLGQVPGVEGTVESVREWVEKLNQFAKDQIEEFKNQPTYTEDRKRGGEKLMDYGVPNGAKGKTVVYANWLADGNCKPVDQDVEQWLQRGGIKAVFTGHQPHGTCPSVIHTPNGLQVFMCDTSYSGLATAKNTLEPANTRGIAYSNVLIAKDFVKVDGVLADGSKHGFSLSRSSIISPKERRGQNLLGTRLAEDYWVKTYLPQQNIFVVAKGKGFSLDIKEYNEDQVLNLVA